MHLHIPPTLRLYTRSFSAIYCAFLELPRFFGSQVSQNVVIEKNVFVILRIKGTLFPRIRKGFLLSNIGFLDFHSVVGLHMTLQVIDMASLPRMQVDA